MAYNRDLKTKTAMRKEITRLRRLLKRSEQKRKAIELGRHGLLYKALTALAPLAAEWERLEGIGLPQYEQVYTYKYKSLRPCPPSAELTFGDLERAAEIADLIVHLTSDDVPMRYQREGAGVRSRLLKIPYSRAPAFPHADNWGVLGNG